MKEVHVDGIRPHRSRRFRNTFLAGLFTMVPMAITYKVLEFLVRGTYDLAGPYVKRLLSIAFDDHVPLPLIHFFSMLLVLSVVLLVGWLASFYVGKKFLTMVDNVMLRLPFVRSIYGGTKQIIEAFSRQKAGTSFKKVVLLEYPRRDCWVLGFVTNETLEESQMLFDKRVVGVFVPSTPNPTTGFLLYYDIFDLLLIDLEVEDAVKLIVSAGLVVPEIVKKKKPITLGESLGYKRDEPPA